MILFPTLTFAFTYNKYKLIDKTENSLIISSGLFGMLRIFGFLIIIHSSLLVTTVKILSIGTCIHMILKQKNLLPLFLTCHMRMK